MFNEYEGGTCLCSTLTCTACGDADDLFDIGWEDFLRRGGVCAVEWSETIQEALEPDTIYVDIRRGAETNQRIPHHPGTRMVTPQTKGKDGSHPVKILALESSAVAASAALCEDETLIAQAFQNSGLTHSQTLLPMVEHLLQGWLPHPGGPGPHRRGGGPGSFTGLRIGVATAKGWLGRPAPLRRLLHLGVRAGLAGFSAVCAAWDARRHQIYNARFQVVGSAPAA